MSYRIFSTSSSISPPSAAQALTRCGLAQARSESSQFHRSFAAPASAPIRHASRLWRTTLKPRRCPTARPFSSPRTRMAGPACRICRPSDGPSQCDPGTARRRVRPERRWRSGQKSWGYGTVCIHRQRMGSPSFETVAPPTHTAAMTYTVKLIDFPGTLADKAYFEVRAS